MTQDYEPVFLVQIEGDHGEIVNALSKLKFQKAKYVLQYEEWLEKSTPFDEDEGSPSFGSVTVQDLVELLDILKVLPISYCKVQLWVQAGDHRQGFNACLRNSGNDKPTRFAEWRCDEVTLTQNVGAILSQIRALVTPLEEDR